MKSTGVVRRIDELGRIVVPKEIRRNLKIREGENMEIFIDDDSIILKKFSKMEDSICHSNRIVDIISRISNCKVLITDRDHIITASDDIKEELNGQLSEDLISLLDNRKSIITDEKITLKLTQNKSIECYYAIYPIISSGDSIGLIIIIHEEKLDKSLLLLLQFVSILISDQLDIA